MKHLIAFLVICSQFLSPGSGLAEPVSEDAAREKHRAVAERIFHGMRLSETEKSALLVNATVDYLTALEKILQARQATLDRLQAAAGPGGKPDDMEVVAAYEQAKAAYLPLRKAYVNTLEEHLVPYHVERVKDGLTHDALPNLYAMYLEMVPDLTPGQKAHILSLLVEARENAMLAVSARGQKQWFDKYRGIANNYIAAQGHDFGRLSKAWDAANAARKSATGSTSNVAPVKIIMIRCQPCGTLNEENSKFCQECGKKL
jgi:hypothetical protein